MFAGKKTDIKLPSTGPSVMQALRPIGPVA